MPHTLSVNESQGAHARVVVRLVGTIKFMGIVSGNVCDILIKSLSIDIHVLPDTC